MQAARELADALLAAGFVLRVAPVAGFGGWYRADLWLDLPLVPAEARWLGAAMCYSRAATLAELRAALAEQRIAKVPHCYCAPDEWRARLLAGCERAAAALAAAGVPLPATTDQETTAP